MANNTVTVSGMLGEKSTYFAGNPVVIEVSGLQFPPTSPIRMCRVKVLADAVEDGSSSDSGEPQYEVFGEFPCEVDSTGSVSLDISSALRSLWATEDFSAEVEAANASLEDSSNEDYERSAKQYFLNIFTEYIDSTDGELTTTQCHITVGGQDIYDIPAGYCVIGGLTEWERYNAAVADISSLEHSNPRYGDASTKPISSLEHVGSESITSWVDLLDTDPSTAVSPATKTIFYPAPSTLSLPSVTGETDDPGTRQNPWIGHSPIVLRDDIPYVDFLFVNRRGAVETCSAQMLDAMGIPVEAKQYARVERPTYKPSRTISARATGGRRSWSMSSGYQTREWAEWWTMEFLMAGRHWMLYNGKFIPVAVTPAKKSVNIYDRTKQEMQSVEFTVTLALEG